MVSSLRDFGRRDEAAAWSYLVCCSFLSPIGYHLCPFCLVFSIALLQRNIKNDYLRVILLLLHTAQCLEQPRLSSSFSVSIGFLSLSAGARNYSELHTDGLAVAQENLLLERAA